MFIHWWKKCTTKPTEVDIFIRKLGIPLWLNTKVQKSNRQSQYSSYTDAILLHVSAHYRAIIRPKGTGKLRVNTWSILQYLCSYWDLSLRVIEYVSCANIIDYKMCMYNNSTLKCLKIPFKMMEC
jgi:hypothetical protein